MSLNRKNIANFIWNIIPFLILFLYLLAFHQNIYSFDRDDSVLGGIQEKYSLSEHLIKLYYNWSGRLSVEATVYIVRSYHVRLWRVLNSLVLTGLCFNLALLLLGNKFWLQDYRKTTKAIWFTCLGLGLINMNVLGSSSFWITGSLYYLWPISVGCVAVLPFYERLYNGPIKITLTNVVYYIIPPLAAIYAGMGNEQVALTLIMLMLIANLALYKSTKTIDRYLLLITALTAISALISWSAPGNQIRYEKSIELEFPNFNELTIGQHLFLGLSWLLNKIINTNRVLLIVLFALISVSLKRNPATRGGRALRTAALFVAAFLVVSSLHLDYLHPEFQAWIHERFYTFNELTDFARAYEKLGRNYNFYLFFVPYLIWIPTLVCTPYLIYKSYQDYPGRGGALALLFCVGICSMALLIFSPTMYASANRVSAIFSIILLFILSNLFHKVQEDIPMPILAALLSIAILNIVFQQEEWSRRYFIHW